MTNRDDFPERIKRAAALRAGYRCSFESCGKLTVGPSEESLEASASIGVAAHISAASPGGKRYQPDLTPQERSSISNAIWLCADHAALIDRDSTAYTIEVLLQMKARHEAACAVELKRGPQITVRSTDLFSVGPDIICLGDIARIDTTEWRFRVAHFLTGDLGKFASYIDQFERLTSAHRYVISNSIGDGRVLAGAPCLIKDNDGYLASFPVFQSFPRLSAADLGSDLALSNDDDLVLSNGDIAFVSGVDALPQKIRLVLSIQEGQSLFNRGFGTRLGYYYEAFRSSAWLERLFKLEVIRQASIPYRDTALMRDYTPLQCVEHVLGVEVLADQPIHQKLLIRVELDVKGLGRWQREIELFLPAGRQ